MLRNKVIIVQSIVILFLLIAGWFFWGRVQKANIALEDVQKLEDEKQRCSDFLSEGSGEFGEFQYCNRLLQNF